MACLNQKIKSGLKVRIDGYGNCKTCEKNADNKKCAGFREIDIKIRVFTVLPK